MDCRRRRSADLRRFANEERSANAPKRIAGCIGHRPDCRYLHCQQSTEDFGSVPPSPGWGHSSGSEEGGLSWRIDVRSFERSYHDSLHCCHENSGSDNHVGSAEVLRKGFAGRWRSSDLGGFAEGGNSLADTEANIRSHLRGISS